MYSGNIVHQGGTSDLVADFGLPGYTHHLASLAQLVEQLTLNQRVVGSSPTRGIGLVSHGCATF